MRVILFFPSFYWPRDSEPGIHAADSLWMGFWNCLFLFIYIWIYVWTSLGKTIHDFHKNLKVIHDPNKNQFKSQSCLFFLGTNAQVFCSSFIHTPILSIPSHSQPDYSSRLLNGLSNSNYVLFGLTFNSCKIIKVQFQRMWTFNCCKKTHNI